MLTSEQCSRGGVEARRRAAEAWNCARDSEFCVTRRQKVFARGRGGAGKVPLLLERRLPAARPQSGSPSPRLRAITIGCQEQRRSMPRARSCNKSVALPRVPREPRVKSVRCHNERRSEQFARSSNKPVVLPRVPRGPRVKTVGSHEQRRSVQRARSFNKSVALPRVKTVGPHEQRRSAQHARSSNTSVALPRVPRGPRAKSVECRARRRTQLRCKPGVPMLGHECVIGQPRI